MINYWDIYIKPDLVLEKDYIIVNTSIWNLFSNKYKG